MRNPKYNLGLCGSELRNIIKNGDESLESCINTLEALKKCYETIQGKVTEDEWCDMEDSCAMLEADIEILKLEDDAEREYRLRDVLYTGDNPALSCVNSNLNFFYNLCDRYRIFIPF